MEGSGQLSCFWSRPTGLQSFLCLLIVLVAAAGSAVSAQSARTFLPEDSLRVVNISDAQISPDGTWVAYLTSQPSGNENRNALWLVRLTNDTSVAATEVDRPDGPFNNGTILAGSDLNPSTPRWSPDSKRLAFYGTVGKQRGLYVASVIDKSPRFVAPVMPGNSFVTYAGESLAWSPDSRTIAFISFTPPDAPGQLADPAQLATDPRVIDRLQYKSRTGFSDGLVAQIFLVNPDQAESRREPRQLTHGREQNHAIDWSPRGDEIAFVSNHEIDPDANNNSDIFAVNAAGTVRQITSTPGCEYEPVWSPDGKWIAYTATTRDVTTIDSVAEDTHLWVVAAEGGRGRELNGAQDRRAHAPQWRGDSRVIYYLANDLGQSTLFGVTLDGQVSPATPGGPIRRTRLSQPPPLRPLNIQSFSISNSFLDPTSLDRPSRGPSQLVTVASEPMRPNEVWLVSSLPGPEGRSRFALRPLTAQNAWLQSVNVVRPEELIVRAPDGTPIQGWLVRPANWRENNRYPLILSIHGGPHGASNPAFSSTFQAFAGRGYAVLYFNPRGSNGYGQRFSDGTLRDWGGGDYRDLMAGVDEALHRYPWIDPDHLYVTGGSYGGYMTNWIITQTSRFRAAASLASVSNLISFYATSLYQDLVHAEFGVPWDNFDLLWERSPLKYVRAAQTPTLFIHGELDNDVHITQAEEMYMALRRRGVNTQFVRYPREGHGFTEPKHKLDQLERMLAWFDANR
jgi:dipeptidyl aminopeptidase/acylaminoacyl peptidase